jgi:prepilin-type N-terminal cleavage/methylation domain-containing protein
LVVVFYYGGNLNLVEHKIRKDFGFSLLEVMVTISILLGLVVAVAAMLRSSVDVKVALAKDARITNRLGLAISRITWDIEHAFIVGLNDTPRGGSQRRFKTIFKVEKSSDRDKLSMTITGNLRGEPGAPAEDTSYVVYELRDSKLSPGRRDLYRGAMSANRDDLKDDPPMRILAKNIKTFRVIPWRGDDWSSDAWDSSRGEWRDRLPAMVRLEIETWNEDDDLPSSDDQDRAEDSNIVAVKTIVSLQQARGMKELKQGSNSVRWF